jgi:hypothetical protein
MPQTQCRHLGKREPANGASHIAESVAAGVAVRFGVTSRSDADAVQNDDRGAPHQGFGIVCT